MPLEAERHSLTLTPDLRENLAQINDPEIRDVLQRFHQLFQEGRIKIHFKNIYTWEKDPSLLSFTNTKPDEPQMNGIIIFVDRNCLENIPENRRKLFGRFFDAVTILDAREGIASEIQRKREELCAKIN